MKLTEVLPDGISPTHSLTHSPTHSSTHSLTHSQAPVLYLQIFVHALPRFRNRVELHGGMRVGRVIVMSEREVRVNRGGSVIASAAHDQEGGGGIVQSGSDDDGRNARR